jgi:hypothetical protein
MSMKRFGTADLPLHGGSVPTRLAQRMTALGTAIAEHIVRDYGAGDFLSRLSDPFWFQALGCVMGMDWHSSGITTSVMGGLKRGLNPRFCELGIAVCGGRGRHSKATPDELRKLGMQTGLDGDKLARTSRLAARVDNNALADGFQLYLHSFVVLKSGAWAVVQQGMNPASGIARRYHWHSETVKDFTSGPHSAIIGENQGEILNLVDSHASQARATMVDITRNSVDEVLKDFRTLTMPARHDVKGWRPRLETAWGGTGGGPRQGFARFRVAVTGRRSWSAHTAVSGSCGGSHSWRPDSFFRSRPLCHRARRQGWPSLSSSA